MKTAIAINHKGVSLAFNPTFEKGDTETRSFAENSKAVLSNKGITIAFDSVVTKEAVIEARRFLDSINIETFQSTLPLTDTEKAALYLDWFNNYTTLKYFARCSCFTLEQAKVLIAEGKVAYEASLKPARQCVVCGTPSSGPTCADVFCGANTTPAPRAFTCISVSSNTNSFGYRAALFLAEDGTGYECLYQAYGTDPVPSKGDVVTEDKLPTYCRRELKKATPALAKKVIAEAKA